MAKEKWPLIVTIILVAFVITFGGCGGGGGGGSSGSSAPAIAAPSNLQVTKSYILGVRATLTWTDNSNNETFFVIDVRPEGGGWMNEYDAVAGGTTSEYIDGVDILYPTAPKVYFRVAAMDESGMESNPSNEVFITLP